MVLRRSKRLALMRSLSSIPSSLPIIVYFVAERDQGFSQLFLEGLLVGLVKDLFPTSNFSFSECATIICKASLTERIFFIAIDFASDFNQVKVRRMKIDEQSNLFQFCELFLKGSSSFGPYKIFITTSQYIATLRVSFCLLCNFTRET